MSENNGLFMRQLVEWANQRNHALFDANADLESGANLRVSGNEVRIIPY